MPNWEIGKVFTGAELDLAIQLRTADKIEARILTPEVMNRINTVTGQENEPKYLAYVLEYLAGLFYPEEGE